MPKKDLIRLPVKGRRPLSFAVSDLPDGTRKYILQQDITGYTDVAINATKIKGDAFIDPTVAACLPISVENPAIKNATATPTVANTVPISVENAALAYDATNDEFYVRSKSTSRPIYADLRFLGGNLISKTNPINVRLADGTDNIPFPTALDTGAFKVREQNPITGFATQTTLALIAGYVDGLETLLGGGLPAALDTGALKTREQNPITGFATAANQIIIQAYIDGIETLLGGGLPAALDTGALKIREQGTPTVTVGTFPDNEPFNLNQVAGTAISATNPMPVRHTNSVGFLDLRGLPLTGVSTDPAAGAEVSVTVPTGKTWRIQYIDFVLVTSSTSANRYVRLLIRDPANIIYRGAYAPVQTASQTRRYCMIVGYPIVETAFDTLNNIRMYIPDFKLGAGYLITSDTANLAANDDFGAMTYFVEEFTP